MEITITVSPTMDKETGWNDGYEHRVLRIPAVYRKQCELILGDFVRLRGKNNNIETFQVAGTFKEDVINNPHTAYATTAVNERVVRGQATNEINLVNNITLGCDPEVFLVDKNTSNILAAYRYMNKNGPVGHDGLLMEFRPNPSQYASEVCLNLWNLIKRGREMLNKKPEGHIIAIVGGSSYGGITAGFHLHYGLPRGLLGRKPSVVNVAKLMTAAFDYYVGVPSILPEGSRDVVRRTANFVRYGKPGEYRIDNRTFEFRMPGGINMAHPIFAQGLMSLGAVVAQDVVSRINTCTDCFTNLSEMVSYEDIKQLYPNLPSTGEFYATICTPDIDRARHHFEIIKNDVRQMVGFAERSEDVEAYFHVLDQDMVFGNNIEHNWGGFYNARQQAEMVVL